MRIARTTVFCGLVCATLGSWVCAEETDPPRRKSPVAEMSFLGIRPSRIKKPQAGKEEDRSKVQSFRAALSLGFEPVVWKAYGMTLRHNFDYEGLWLHYQHWPHQPIERLHRVGYRLMAVQPLGPSWKLTLLFRPALASDFVKMTWQDLTAGGGLIVGRRLGLWELGVGAAYLNEFGRSRFSPSGLVRYGSQSERWRVNLLLPLSGEVWWVANPSWQFGATTRLQGGSYHISRQGEFQGYSIAMSDWILGPAVIGKLAEDVTMRLEGGTTLKREFEIRRGPRNRDEVFDWDLKNAAFLKFSLILRT